MFRYRGEPVFIDPGLFLAATGGPLELHAARPSYTEPVALTQVVRDDAGAIVETRALPATMLNDWVGLKGFLDVTVTDREGNQVAASTNNFCPNGFGRERINDEGPFNPSYPEDCYGNPFTRSTVWGIDEGWAANVFGYDTRPLDLRRGRYTLTTSIAQQYIDAFGIDPAASSGSVIVRVKRAERCDCPMSRKGLQSRSQPSDEVPIVTAPDPATLPDLYALPSWGIHVENRRAKSRLTFGATIGAGGASSMVVEGFRREGEPLMDAFQYFFRDGEVYGKAPVGSLEFDDRDGHDHWHFLQFARYTLLSADSMEVRRSKKESFCLAPTDPLDLALPGAVWNPGQLGLHSACGGPNSLWTRETLPLGWGDTYFQGLPGQSFNITDLPNGTYYIAVEANPDGLLYEQSATNNLELREVRLRGRAGERRVVVPPWNGIDTE
ncbi:MAG: lysyl oxidase family protein, partial [Actinomycetota bacterium]|nr:lysyl oxidase family protein [Actinomycetota bacterium]